MHAKNYEIENIVGHMVLIEKYVEDKMCSDKYLGWFYRPTKEGLLLVSHPLQLLSASEVLGIKFPNAVFIDDAVRCKIDEVIAAGRDDISELFMEENHDVLVSFVNKCYNQLEERSEIKNRPLSYLTKVKSFEELYKDQISSIKLLLSA